MVLGLDLMSGPLRYDLLCIEGIARALRIFLQLSPTPEYKYIYPPGGEADLLTVTIDPEVRMKPPQLRHS